VKIEDFVVSVTNSIRERLTSPLTGALVLAWIAWNYRFLMVVFSTKAIEEKFAYLDHWLYEDRADALTHLFWGPAVTAIVIVVIYPVFTLGAYHAWAFFEKRIIEIQQKVDGGKLVPRKEFEKFVADFFDQQTRNETQLQRRVAENSALRSENEELESQLKASMDKVAEVTAKLPGIDKSTFRNQRIISMLTSNAFTLVFNPHLGNSGFKSMLFGADGLILQGRNDNENSWRVENGNLEMLNSKGEVHNRFVFHAADNAFYAKDDPKEALPAIKGQKLVPNG
jgi:regulator of replication initiation timing